MSSFDFRITALGADMLLRPLTQAGRNWAGEQPSPRPSGAWAAMP